jgi:hypothetical protein
MTAARPDHARMSGERRHGPLPVLLVGLTFVTGLVDAFSYLSLGHVFVANMTGNVWCPAERSTSSTRSTTTRGPTTRG